MRVKNFIGKSFNTLQLRDDMKSREISGAHYFEKGQFDGDLDVVEFVICNHEGYAYALDIFLNDQVIGKIERVKFQRECGGWRSKNIAIKRFPKMFYEEDPIEETLKVYSE